MGQLSNPSRDLEGLFENLSDDSPRRGSKIALS
jgi:hypothetical protein